MYKYFFVNSGFELPLRIFSEYVGSNKLSSITTDLISQTVTFQGSQETKTFVPLGYSLGFGAILQFNYRLAGGLTIGAEAAPALTYVHRNSEDGRIERYENENLINNDPFGGSYKRTFFQENRFSIQLGYQF